MGTEYYMVKPAKKEVYYLGKHMTCPDGIVNGVYKEANYIEYDCFEDFFWDFLKENFYKFKYTNYTLEKIGNIIYNLYEWCEYEKVYFDNDCHDDAEWTNWKETGSLFPNTEELTEEEARKELDEINKELIYRDIYESHVTTEEDKNKILETYPHFAEKKNTPLDCAKFLFDENEEKANLFLEMLWEYRK